MAGKLKKDADVSQKPSAIRVIGSVLIYAVMIALILIFFSGNGEFIYEAF